MAGFTHHLHRNSCHREVGHSRLKNYADPIYTIPVLERSVWFSLLLKKSQRLRSTQLGGRALFEHFRDEYLDEFDVDKWNLGVDPPPFAFEFR